MTKDELVAALADKALQSKASVTAVLAALPDVLGGVLAGGNGVVIPGVVTLKPATRAARQGRNPSTGAAISIPEKRVVTAKAAPSLERMMSA